VTPGGIPVPFFLLLLGPPPPIGDQGPIYITDEEGQVATMSDERGTVAAGG
jgi:hypothetical protein